MLHSCCLALYKIASAVCYASGRFSRALEQHSKLLCYMPCCRHATETCFSCCTLLPPCRCLQAFRQQLVSGEPSPDELAARFAELAGQESHCSSARRGGDLGDFG
jgi:hypothetical protein